jgi:hypothetical protein
MVEAHKVYNHTVIEGMVLKPKMLATEAELLVIPAYFVFTFWMTDVICRYDHKQPSPEMSGRQLLSHGCLRSVYR